MKISHEFSGTRHRLLVEGRTGGWVPVTQPATARLSPAEVLLIPTRLCESPAFPDSNKVYLVQALKEDVMLLPPEANLVRAVE